MLDENGLKSQTDGILSLYVENSSSRVDWKTVVTIYEIIRQLIQCPV